MQDLEQFERVVIGEDAPPPRLRSQQRPWKGGAGGCGRRVRGRGFDSNTTAAATAVTEALNSSPPRLQSWLAPTRRQAPQGWRNRLLQALRRQTTRVDFHHCHQRAFLWPTRPCQSPLVGPSSARSGGAAQTTVPQVIAGLCPINCSLCHRVWRLRDNRARDTNEGSRSGANPTGSTSRTGDPSARAEQAGVWHLCASRGCTWIYNHCPSASYELHSRPACNQPHAATSQQTPL